jgi:excisionase family DNA binding protein
VVIIEKFEYLTTDELCQQLKISKNTANNWRRKGLPYIRVGNTVRYEKVKVEEWLKNQK